MVISIATAVSYPATTVAVAYIYIWCPRCLPYWALPQADKCPAGPKVPEAKIRRSQEGFRWGLDMGQGRPNGVISPRLEPLKSQS
jgi:hypothetical protein